MVKLKTIISKSPHITQKLGQRIGKFILSHKYPLKTALVVAIEGELGAGKTVFAKGFARGIGLKEIIKSPTFILMHPYRVSNSFFKTFYHLDVYRLSNEKDLKPLKFGKILENPLNLILIEWSERVKRILPKKRINIHIDHVNKNARKFVVEFGAYDLERKILNFKF
ncbi:MAG: tRNA (adenosine(37)-N6)-threonylcarbamoyltransferase complex ATPase subunit type 1 TsaE [Parcubacteria group bacterium]|nr:tRNA (adenosine(37)-N6)-threonylcarbamoyltransferase complex ATPase subunit type 1 TsaE [Parcubacteria group bacterium]